MCVCVCVYLLSTGVCEVDLVLQAAVHLADVRFGRLHVDHDLLLRDSQLRDRRADFGCGGVRRGGLFSAREILLHKRRRRGSHSLPQRGLNLRERAQADLVEGQEKARTLA